MIRVLLGSALSVLGIGAVASLGPTLLSGPRGEPLVMTAPDQPTLQAANYDGDACGSTLVFADPADTQHPSGARIVVFSLPANEHEVALAVEDFPHAPAEPRTVVLVFDEAGRLISADESSSLELAAADCPETVQPEQHNPI